MNSTNQLRLDNRLIPFCQEIYDETGKLVEVYEKYPIDRGHQKVES